MTTVIAAAGRSPLGSLQGSLAALPAPRLAAQVVAALVSRLGIAEDEAGHAIFGNVLAAGLGQAPARQVAVYGNLGRHVPAVTVNKMCGSGLEAVIQGSRLIRTGEADIVVAGGMESMSNAPYLLPGARAGLRLGDSSVIDSLVHDGLQDAFSDRHMGSCAELCAARYVFSREEQDEFAALSYRRAQRAAADGLSAREIIPVTVPGRRGTEITVDRDEGPDQVDFARIPTLRPVFEKDGTITAANASTINDGAAALVLAGEAHAAERGWEPLAIIRGHAVHAHEPEWFTTAPVTAISKLLGSLGWTAADVDLYEINEAFSVVTLVAIRELGLDPERVNVRGGAIALGHPIGASGARILVTLIDALRQRGGGRGVAGICIGGGEALALALEVP